MRVVPNIQVTGVPEDVHERLDAQAGAAGLSLNEYLLAWLDDIARMPTVSELAERIQRRGAFNVPSSPTAVRAERGVR